MPFKDKKRCKEYRKKYYLANREERLAYQKRYYFEKVTSPKREKYLKRKIMRKHRRGRLQ